MASAHRLSDLRRYAIARSLFAPTSLAKAIARLRFVQADPIRAPARAQDLTLRLRVKEYRAGELERLYPELGIEEEFVINYGFVDREVQALMHPRVARAPWDRTTKKRAQKVLAFVNERGEAHPRDVGAHFRLGTVTNYWGGASSATTRLLDQMQFRGMLRVVRRSGGIRVYAPARFDAEALAARPAQSRADELLRVIAAKYAPLPSPSFARVVNMLRYGAPQLSKELGIALKNARATWPNATIDGVAWYWPPHDDPRRVIEANEGALDGLRFLAPFDPVVWDRARFELFWDWTYRFEAYTPVAKRKLGYYALPLLWRERVVGWGNFAVREDALDMQVGFVSGSKPRDRGFARALEAEHERIRAFLR